MQITFERSSPEKSRPARGPDQLEPGVLARRCAQSVNQILDERKSLVRDVVRRERSAAQQLREHYGFANAGVYDPPGVGGTGVIYILHDVTNPEAYGDLPKDPHIPWVVRLWKGPAKWFGNIAMVGGVLGVVLHYMRFGPKRVDEKKGEES